MAGKRKASAKGPAVKRSKPNPPPPPAAATVPPTTVPPPTGKENTTPGVKKKVENKPTSKVEHKKIYKRCQLYHRMKHDILAPFITKLMLEHRWADLTDDLDDEMTVFDSRLNGSSVAGDGSRRELTLGTATEEDDEQESLVGSDASYHHDWRSESE